MRRLLLLALSLFVTAHLGVAGAAEYGSRDEAVAMVKRVVAMFAREGEQATFAAVTDATRPEFHDRDLYPFIYDFDGWNLAHGANPKMVGKLWISTKDQDGVRLVKRMVDIASGPGEGWVDYKWPHPTTHKIQDKSAYIEKLGERYFVGVGVYMP